LNNGNGLKATGGGYEPGWVASDDSNIAATNTNLASVSPSPYATWRDSAGTEENLPINCVNWYEAYAFCIWDGGFLPSEAEWEYAAVALITFAATEANPQGIALGPDNNIWFTDSGTNPVVRLNPTTRVFTEFALPGEPGALGIAVGPDHNLSITSSDVCRITPTGAVTNLGSNSFGTSGPIAGPDGLGNMWFVNDLDNIGRITP
jgi:hypothetical protein